MKQYSYTSKNRSNIPIQYEKKYSNKYMTVIHQYNLETELMSSQI